MVIQRSSFSLPVINKSKTKFPTRYVFALLGFFGFFNVYAMRVNLNVAIIAMVKESNHSSGTNSQEVMACQELLQEVPHGNSSAKSHSIP
ncbi:sialin, partial [Trichonephila inaurata madagascariensis]